MPATLHIGRLQSDFLVPAGQVDPEGLARDRSADLERDLGAALEQALSRRLDSDPQVWLIPRLDISLEIGAHWDGDQVARAFAQAVARALEAAMSRPPGEIIRFSSQAAYLGRFLMDLAGGRAWHHWYYHRFDGLAMLPMSAALRSALCAPGAPALEALSGLAEMDREPILTALSEPDATRVLEHLTRAGRPVEPDAGLSALHRAGIPPAQETEPPARDALRSLLRVAGQSPDLVGPSLAELALSLAVLARVLAPYPDQGPSASRAGGDWPQALLQALRRQDLAALFDELGTEAAQALQPLLSCPPERVMEIASGLLGMDPRSDPQTRPDPLRPTGSRYGAAAPRHTRFGGLLMLLPLLADWPLDQALGDLPPLGETPAPALVRFLILVLCAGPTRVDAALDDPVLRTLSAIPQDLARGDIRSWIEAARGQGLPRRLGQLTRHRSQGEAGPLILARSDRTWLLIRGRTETWLEAWDGAPNRLSESPVIQGPLLIPDNVDPGSVGGASSPRLDPCGSSSRRDAPPTGGPPEQRPGNGGKPEITGYEAGRASYPDLAPLLARLDRLAEDLAFVTPGPGLSRDRDTAPALAVTAQGLLRDLARRLPGFSQSGLAYLYANFLDMDASLEVSEERYLARLGRPPINVILAVTGLARGSHRIGWLDRPLRLYQGD